MALVGFPEQIEVTLGPGWTNTKPAANPLGPNDVVVLTQAGSSFWTEDGTENYNETTNRLRFEFTSLALGPVTWERAILIFGAVGTGMTSVWQVTATAYTPLYPSYQNYPFGEMWSLEDRIVFSFGKSTWVNPSSYNPDVFSLLREAPSAAPEIAVLDPDSNPIADDEDTPVSFGSAAVGGSAVQKVFTVQNNGEATLTISSVTVPTGYEIDASSQVPGAGTTIESSSSKTLTINMLTAEAGTKSGDVTINSDDPTFSIFNFAITGIVTESNFISIINENLSSNIDDRATINKKITVNINDGPTIPLKNNIRSNSDEFSPRHF